MTEKPNNDYIEAYADETARMSANARRRAVGSVLAGAFLLLGIGGVYLSFQDNTSSPISTLVPTNAEDEGDKTLKHSLKNVSMIGKWSGENYVIDISGVIENDTPQEWSAVPQYAAKAYSGDIISTTTTDQVKIDANNAAAFLLTLEIPTDLFDDISVIEPTGDLAGLSDPEAKTGLVEQTTLAKDQAVEARERKLKAEKEEAEKKKEEAAAKRYAAELAALEEEYKDRDLDAEIEDSQNEIDEAVNGNRDNSNAAGNMEETSDGNSGSALKTRNLNRETNGAAKSTNKNTNKNSN